MIDFKNAEFLALNQVPEHAFSEMLKPLLIEGETILDSYQSIRDGVVFTNKRVITINVQGLTGRKKDFTSLPYSKIQAFSIETAGTFDFDCELDLWFSGLGRVRLAFTKKADIGKISRMISEFSLR